MGWRATPQASSSGGSSGSGSGGGSGSGSGHKHPTPVLKGLDMPLRTGKSLGFEHVSENTLKRQHQSEGRTHNAIQPYRPRRPPVCVF